MSGEKRRVSIRSVILVAVPTLLVLLTVYYVERSPLPMPLQLLSRYFCLIPIALAAYRHGLWIGLVTSGFQSSAFFPLLYERVRTTGVSASSLSLLGFVLLLNGFAYIMADLVTSVRRREALESEVSDWERLLTSASALEEVVSFILEQARRIGRAEEAAVLLRNPVDAEWQMIPCHGKVSLGCSIRGGGRRQNVAEWLLDLEEPTVLNAFQQDPRFARRPSSRSDELRSLLARPLYHENGRLMALLVLMDNRTGSFGQHDLNALDGLVAKSEKALEQAGLYARTDHALARRAEQMAAIQRTARQLNAALDSRQILRYVLACALEITNAEAGFAGSISGSVLETFQIRGAKLGVGAAYSFVASMKNTEHFLAGLFDASREPTLLTSPSSRLSVPVRQDERVLGLVVLESTQSQAFDEADRRVLSALSDHAAIALENTRLFQEVVTERQRARLIVQSVAEGLFTTDVNRRILTFNPAAEELTEWAAEDAVGQPCREVLHCTKESCEADCPVNKALKEDTAVHDDRRAIRNRLGTDKVVSLSAAPLAGSDDQPDGAVVIFRDITERDQFERLQGEFVAGVSHELRTPIANISTVVQMLKEESEAAQTDRYQEYVNTLASQSQRLSDFADRMLDVFQLEKGELSLQPRPLPLSLLAERSVDEWESADEVDRLTIRTPEISPWVWADENAVGTILRNLIENALKYSPSDSDIVVLVEGGENGYARVSVEDGGPGIPPEHQAKVFDRFYRVDGSDSQSIYGRGLGLYIAKKLVDAMAGQIWVESTVGKGSRFTFTLPEEEVRGDEDLDRRR
jgi:PAS domain S-box-containing protein